MKNWKKENEKLEKEWNSYTDIGISDVALAREIVAEIPFTIGSGVSEEEMVNIIAKVLKDKRTY